MGMLDLNSLPGISVIVPCRNAEKWITRAINSVLDQTYPKVELVVVDDGSVDCSVEIVKSYGDRLRLYNGSQEGACAARNLGLASCSTEYVIFLDADDYIEREAILHWMTTAAETRSDIVLGAFDLERNKIRVAGGRLNSEATSTGIICQWLEGRYYVPCCSIAWRRSYLNSIGGWNPNIPRRQDAELAIRALLSGATLSVSSAGKSVYVQHEFEGRVSQQSGRTILEAELRMWRELWELAVVRNLYSTQRSFSKAFYRLAYEAFSKDLDDIGERALRQARDLGLQGHPGLIAHRVLSNVLGLRRKMHFTRWLRDRRFSFRKRIKS